MTESYNAVTLLSDLGTADGTVGVLHSILAQYAPLARVIDLTHEVAPLDVRGGGWILARAVQYLCPGVIVACIDPGAGGDRRLIAVEVANGAAVLLGPDNGLLAGAVSMVGGATRAVVLDVTEHHLSTGSVLSIRDVLVPVAAALCNGAALDAVGSEIDVNSLMPGLLAVSREEDGVVIAEVLAVDRFGNVQLNIEPELLEPYGQRVAVLHDDARHSARWVRSFDELGTGEFGLVVDSDGLTEVVSNRSSAAQELNLEVGVEVRIDHVDSTGSTVTTTPVGISPKPERTTP
jgi:S-adenosylmethionine hydrolase